MSRNTKIVIAILAVLAVFVAVLGYWASARRAKQTAMAMATVVSAEREVKKGDDATLITLSYPAGSATVQGKARVNGVHLEDYPAGRQMRICYDPADVKSLRIEDGACG
jgi:Protein of unknown function (DUF3592)